MTARKHTVATVGGTAVAVMVLVAVFVALDSVVTVFWFGRLQSNGLCSKKYATKSVQHSPRVPRKKTQSKVVVQAPGRQGPDLEAGARVLVAL